MQITSIRRRLGVGVVAIALAGTFGMSDVVNADFVADPDAFLIDDFSSQSSTAAVGTMWRCFTDRVMGGVSNASHTVQRRDGVDFLRLQGEVSLENNGGFVQVALELQRRGDVFDASPYDGVRLTVRGNGARYFVHFKNRQTPQHWYYYEAGFETTDTWSVIELPFAAFESERGESNLDASTLRRIAIVAAHEAYTADLSVARVEFYRDKGSTTT